MIYKHQIYNGKRQATLELIPKNPKTLHPDQ